MDLEPRRSVEIDSLIAQDNAQSESFTSKDEYVAYISDVAKPQLPWETEEKYMEIIRGLVAEIQRFETDLQKVGMEVKNLQIMSLDELKDYIPIVRTYRQLLQEEEERKKSQEVEQIASYIETLENIFNYEQRPILLEKMSALGLYALDDALRIQANYPVGDDNEPTFTAPANKPDIECFYETFNAICEVTMLTSRNQWYNEGQPVMRHLRDFEEQNTGRPVYCLFIAPRLHRDTLNTFWTAVRYEYEGRPQRIVPLSIVQFVCILKVLLRMRMEGKFLHHSDICRLYDDILDSSRSCNNSQEWIRGIPNAISSWQETLTSQASL